jgi:hypothetical protein
MNPDASRGVTVNTSVGTEERIQKQESLARMDEPLYS